MCLTILWHCAFKGWNAFYTHENKICNFQFTKTKKICCISNLSFADLEQDLVYKTFYIISKSLLQAAIKSKFEHIFLSKTLMHRNQNKIVQINLTKKIWRFFKELRFRYFITTIAPWLVWFQHSNFIKHTKKILCTLEEKTKRDNACVFKGY